MPLDGHGLVDDQAGSDDAGHHVVLLGAQDVVDLLVDGGEVGGDLVHCLLHGDLRHDRPGVGQEGWVGQGRARSLRELDESPDLALARPHHTCAQTRCRPLSPYLLTDRADSLVSFTQRPELAAIMEPTWAAAAPALRTDSGRAIRDPATAALRRRGRPPQRSGPRVRPRHRRR